MNEIHKINIKSDTKNLSLIAGFIEKNFKKVKVSPVIIDEVLVGVDEAVTNVIKHSYKNDSGDIKMVLKMTDDKIIISIFDNGLVFNPDKVPKPEFSKKLSKRTIGGWGLYLMKQFMDEVEFNFKGTEGHAENEVMMVKYI